MKDLTPEQWTTATIAALIGAGALTWAYCAEILPLAYYLTMLVGAIVGAFYDAIRENRNTPTPEHDEHEETEQ